MNLAAYELEGRHIYSVFADTIARLVETISAQQPAFHIQQIQHRAKGVSSLRDKLKKLDATESDQIEGIVKDLAGCRVILYTNADVANFVVSGIVSDNFAVDWDRTKFHYPMEAPTAEDGFISYNYVVGLKEDRLALPEYARFAGMVCEIQVQTTLDHAWSEMAHDTVYKPPPAGFGGAVMKSVADRMTAIIQQHLRPAGFDFQKVVADVRTLERGRALLERNPLQLLLDAADNNERDQLLSEYVEYVLPYYDELPTLAPAIRKTMVSVIKAARAAPVVPWEIGGISVEGRTSDFIFPKALDAIDRLRFVSAPAIDATFRVLCELYRGATQSERKRLHSSLERLARHDLHVWQAAGPLVPVRLVALIGKLADKRREALRPLIVRTLRFLLDPDVQGSSSTYNTMTLQMGGVIATSAYVTARRDAITVLEALFANSSNADDQREILTAFNSAGRLPTHGTLTVEIVAATYVDTTRIVRFVHGLAAQLPYEVLQAYEHDLVWKFRHTSRLPPMFADNAELEALRQDLHDAILSFRNAINADAEFVIYKTLVGFESVFPMSWTTASTDVKGESQYRTAEIDRLASSVDEATFGHWLSIIRRCARTKSNDGATFPSFRSFLVELGRAKPELLMRLFDNLDEDLDWFVSSMLQGLEGGPLEAEATQLAAAWIGEGQHLLQIVAYCDVAKALPVDLLEQATRRAIQQNEERAVATSMSVCVHRVADAEQKLVSLFAEGLSHFVSRKSPDWVNSVWYRPELNGIVGRLEPALAQKMLDSFVYLPEIDFHAETVLLPLAHTNPLQLLAMFHKRILYEQEDGRPARYDAVPYHFERLPPAFEPVAREVVLAVRQWFDQDDDLFEYRAGALVARLFTDFALVSTTLHELVARAEGRDIEYVLTIMRGYHGDPAILPLCKVVVATLPAEDRLLRYVPLALDQSGVVQGEFGLVELHQKRRAEMEVWLNDDEPRVREFATHRIKNLDLQIKAEQRRALEELELRKRHYGE